MGDWSLYNKTTPFSYCLGTYSMSDLHVKKLLSWQCVESCHNEKLFDLIRKLFPPLFYVIFSENYVKEQDMVFFELNGRRVILPDGPTLNIGQLYILCKLCIFNS